MLTPTSNQVPLPEGAAPTASEAGFTTKSPRNDGEDGFVAVMDGVQPVVVPGVPILPNGAEGGAQKMPERGGTPSQETMPTGPWPVLDDMEPMSDRAPAVEQLPVGADGVSSGVEEQPTPADASPVIPTVGTAGVMPVVGEVQRVEHAVEHARHAPVDARVMLAPSPATTVVGEQIQSSLGSMPAQTQADGPARSVLSSLMTLSTGSGGVARIRLDPPLLGTVTVQLSVHAGGVTCTLHAERSAGAEALVRDLASLRSGLEAKGLVVDRIVVQGPHGIEVQLNAEEQAESTQDEQERRERRQRRRAGQEQAQDDRWLFEDMLAVQPAPEGPIEGETS